MGSMGWARWCYWCQGWVNDPYIIDWIENPLCDTCFDRHVENTGTAAEPPHPNARCHKAAALLVVLPQLQRNFEVARYIACFIELPWRPGRGSRQTPVGARLPVG